MGHEQLLVQPWPWLLSHLASRVPESQTVLPISLLTHLCPVWSPGASRSDRASLKELRNVVGLVSGKPAAPLLRPFMPPTWLPRGRRGSQGPWKGSRLGAAEGGTQGSTERRAEWRAGREALAPAGGRKERSWACVSEGRLCRIFGTFRIYIIADV